MDDPKHTHIPAPGLPESIHPEIGNGSVWESDRHQLLLRLPDPTKWLDAWLPALESTSETKNSEAISSPPGIEQADTVHDTLTEQKAEADRITSNQEYPGKGKKKKKKIRKVEESEPDMAEELLNQEDPEPLHPHKPGKRLRKAAETIHKQEEERHMAENEDAMHPDQGLSPYTRWLKNLAGSEYVHPYDDDFALAGAQGQVKQGISETFADLLASQGHIRQAIEMYTRLMEKYPEKSAFFAAKIEALQSS